MQWLLIDYLVGNSLLANRVATSHKKKNKKRVKEHLGNECMQMSVAGAGALLALLVLVVVVVVDR